MATLDELAERRKRVIAEIQRRGGAASAPGYARILADLDGQIRTMRGGGTGGTTGGGTGGGTGGTTGNGADIGTAIQGANDIIGPATDYGRNLANEFTPVGFMGDRLNVNSTPEMMAFLDRLNQLSQTAGNLTPLEQEAINNLRAGLGGYTGQETQAMREAAMQEMNRQAAGQARQLAIQQSRSGVTGASALAQRNNVGRQQQQSQGNFERDLLIRNADEIQNRRAAFAGTVRGTEDARFGRQTNANQMYGGALTGEEGARQGREVYNNSLGANEALARSGTALSGAGMFTGLATGQQAQNSQQNYLDWLKSFQEQSQKQQMDLANKYFRQANSSTNSASNYTGT